MIRFVGVEEKHIRQMAILLAKRHERERQQFSYLPAKFEEIDETEPVIREILQRPFVGGIVAVRGIEVIGYLLYEFKEETARGRYVWIDYASAAVSAQEHPRLLRLLYAEAGAEWVKHGYFHHVILSPLGGQRELGEWLEQGFRYEQKYAVLPLDEFEATEPKQTLNVSFRRGRKEDAETLRKMAMWNSIHQAGAPSWNPITKEAMDEVKRGYEALSEDQEAFLWLAEQQSRVAGFHVYFPLNNPLSLVVPEQCAELAAASTNPDLRGKGVGRSLANHCFVSMKQEGFRFIFTDWHTPNHLASYFWPRLGFMPVMARLSRQLDPRIAWAHGK